MFRFWKSVMLSTNVRRSVNTAFFFFLFSNLWLFLLCILQQWLYAEIQGNKTRPLNCCHCYLGPLHMWKPLYPVCWTKKKKNRAAASWRSARESAPWPGLSTGPLSVCTKRFCYCRTPGSVGPSTDTQSLSLWNTSSTQSRSRTHRRKGVLSL